VDSRYCTSGRNGLGVVDNGASEVRILFVVADTLMLVADFLHHLEEILMPDQLEHDRLSVYATYAKSRVEGFLDDYFARTSGLERIANALKP
jgi:hypothetical protein